MAASVLLKLFIHSNERCHTTKTPTPCMSITLFSNVNNIKSMIPEDHRNFKKHGTMM